MPNELMRMRPQAPSEQAPMPEMAPVSESDWLAQMIQQRPQILPQQPNSIGAYIANMRAADPYAPQARQAPQQQAQWPGISDLISMFMGKPAPDQAIYNKMAPAVGNMFANNQQHRQRLDDMERERVRNQMMLNQLQGMR